MILGKIKLNKKYRKALGCDPGKSNFAWAIYIRNEGLTHTGVMDGLLSVGDATQFRKNFRRLVNTHEPDCLCIERFHSQPGRGSKKNFELVNLAIGIAIDICLSKKIPIELVTASTHKGWLARNFEVQLHPDAPTTKPRKGRRRRITKKYDITTYEEWSELNTEHEVDAANMAKFALEHIFTE